MVLFAQPKNFVPLTKYLTNKIFLYEHLQYSYSLIHLILSLIKKVKISLFARHRINQNFAESIQSRKKESGYRRRLSRPPNRQH